MTNVRDLLPPFATGMFAPDFAISARRSRPFPSISPPRKEAVTALRQGRGGAWWGVRKADKPARGGGPLDGDGASQQLLCSVAAWRHLGMWSEKGTQAVCSVQDVL